MSGKDKFIELLKCIAFVYNEGESSVDNLIDEEENDDINESDEE